MESAGSYFFIFFSETSYQDLVVWKPNLGHPLCSSELRNEHLGPTTLFNE